jgi:pimeloyl-ACP methyl ester carboxylesterase
MLVDIGDHQLYIDQLGHGRPAVIFDGGLGDTSETWGSIPTVVARFTQACVYDRAGLGQSEAATRPRSSGRIVDELRTLLALAAIRPPFVLVGHSAGGENAYLYACRYPEEVVGLVLLDPGHSDLLECYRPVLSPSLWRAFQDRMIATYARIEGIDYATSLAEMRAAPPLPPVPLVVLGRGQHPPATGFLPGWPVAQTEPLWRASLADLAGRSPLGTFHLAEHSGHYIYRDEPDRVIAAIRQVVDAARGQAADEEVDI